MSKSVADLLKFGLGCLAAIGIAWVFSRAPRGESPELAKRVTTLETELRETKVTLQALRGLMEAWTARIDQLPNPSPPDER